MTVFVCGEEPEDIFSSIYDAWMSRLGHANVRIEPAGCNQELFCQYRMAEPDFQKAAKVMDSIRRKLSEEIYELVYKAALSYDRYRADKIYRFLIYGFAAGPGSINRMQIPAVYELFAMNRHIRGEYDHLLGFTRFSRMQEGVMVAKIGPKNDLTVLLARHFADRMPEEDWILCDLPRKKAAVHQNGHGWAMVRVDSAQWQERLCRDTDERMFEDLWKTFHQSIAIAERTNPRCQMNMLPLRFRPYMTEFQR